MTLIIGIKCVDGIVMAADGAATFDSMGQPTIRQQLKKLEILEDGAILGTSGPVGLHQRFRQEILDLCRGKGLLRKNPPQAMAEVREVLWKHSKQEWEAAAVTAPVIGPLSRQSAMCSVILGLPLPDSPHLIQFNYQMAREEATMDLPFIAIGSGQPLADPFLAFLRRIFWSDGLPLTIPRGAFAAVWTLDHAIKTLPGGVTDPKQVVVIEKHDGAWRTHEMADGEVEDHLRMVAEAEDYLRRFPPRAPAAAENELPLPPPERARR